LQIQDHITYLHSIAQMYCCGHNPLPVDVGPVGAAQIGQAELISADVVNFRMPRRNATFRNYYVRWWYATDDRHPLSAPRLNF
jgi:hypothetical protein